MNRFKKLLCFIVLALLIPAQTTFAASAIVIKGSTTVLPVVQAEAEAYMKAHPGVNISLSGGGSGDGVKALIDKSTDIANSSRELKPEEITLAAKNGVKPVLYTIAIDAIAPIVHPKNRVQNLTIDQLSQIYQGSIRNWKEVGGDNLAIVVISRDSSSGTFESWGHLVLHGAKVTPRAQMQASSGAIVQAVSKNKYAIGYIGIGYLNRTVKPLTVNGVAATTQNALAKTYPVARPLYMITAGEPRGETGSFIKFVLSREGQKIVEKTGFVPLKKK